MKNIFRDIWSVISSMSFLDFVLYFSVITLIVLIVSLIYVIYTEKLEEQANENTLKEKEKMEEKQVVVPIEKETSKDDFDLLSIVDEINENPEPLIDMTAYEEEQERKAIISYDELIKSTNKELNYDKEELVDDVIPVKKLTLSNIDIPREITYIPKEPKIEIEENVVEKTTASSQLFSYEKEEAFLKALKQLNELLN